MKRCDRVLLGGLLLLGARLSGPSASLCVAVDSAGNVVTGSAWGGAPASWRAPARRLLTAPGSDSG